MAQVETNISNKEGLRERKRRETAQRITDAATSLFVENGYDETTLDDIAARASISRRSFFHYFKSKDDILLSLQRDIGVTLAEAVKAQSKDANPYATIRDVLVRAADTYPTEKAIVIDRIMRSSASVQARKSAAYIEHEKTLFEGLRERWPDMEDEMRLRLVAMQAIGAVRLTTDTFSREGGKRPLADIFREYFDALIS